MPDLSKFKDELGNIKNLEVRDFIANCLLKAPEHFWYKPSSSTGKYHLEDEFIEGGNVKHTKRVCSVAEILMPAWAPPINIDAVRGACILHDICKYGSNVSESKYTVDNHPQLAAKLIMKILCPAPYKGIIINAIERHMGKWGAKKPRCSEDWIVHLADMIATNYVP